MHFRAYQKPDVSHAYGSIIEHLLALSFLEQKHVTALVMVCDLLRQWESPAQSLCQAVWYQASEATCETIHVNRIVSFSKKELCLHV